MIRTYVYIHYETIHYDTLQYHTTDDTRFHIIQYTPLGYSTVQHDTMYDTNRYDTIHCAIHFDVTRYNVRYNSIWHDTMYNTIRCDTIHCARQVDVTRHNVRYSSIWHDTLYDTIRFDTIQFENDTTQHCNEVNTVHSPLLPVWCWRSPCSDWGRWSFLCSRRWAGRSLLPCLLIASCEHNWTLCEHLWTGVDDAARRCNYSTERRWGWTQLTSVERSGQGLIGEMRNELT